MRWRGRERSDNVEDRRLSVGKKMSLGGGIGGIIIALIFIILGGNPKQVLQLLDPGTQTIQTQSGQNATQDDDLTKFISVVLKDTEDVWNKIFTASGRKYREPKLVLFRQSVRSACGFSGSATGPFYCPADEKVYIDLDFL